MSRHQPIARPEDISNLSDSRPAVGTASAAASEPSGAVSGPRNPTRSRSTSAGGVGAGGVGSNLSGTIGPGAAGVGAGGVGYGDSQSSHHHPTADPGVSLDHPLESPPADSAKHLSSPHVSQHNTSQYSQLLGQDILTPSGDVTGNTLFNFDWEGSLESLSNIPADIYEPQGELVGLEAPQSTSPDTQFPAPDSSFAQLDIASGNLSAFTSTTSVETGPKAGGPSGTPLQRNQGSLKRKAESAAVDWAQPPAPSTKGPGGIIGGIGKEEAIARLSRPNAQNQNTVHTPSSAKGKAQQWMSQESPASSQGGSNIETPSHPNVMGHSRSNSIPAGTAVSAGGASSTSTRPPPISRRNTGIGEGDHNIGRAPHLQSRVVRGPQFPEIPKILPHEKVFPIQIGSELFRLSGASISSDGKPMLSLSECVSVFR
jgi:hypothetical protein